MPTFEPRLIEHGFPCHQVGAETQRERGASSALPPLYFLHVWWTRKPLTPSRAAILASLSAPDLSHDDFLRKLGIEQRVIDIGGERWPLTNDLVRRIRRNAGGTEVLPVDAFVLSRFHKETKRRAHNLKVATELERSDPTIAGDPVLQRWKSECRPLTTQWVRVGVELPVLRRAADPAFAQARIGFEKAHDFRTSENIYGYERAFQIAPVLAATRGVVLDPAAGGGSIAFEAMRLGYSVIANELNPVATAILYATLDFPARFGASLADDLRSYGNLLVGRMHTRQTECFPASNIPEAERAILIRSLSRSPELVPQYLDERIADFLFCRQVTCPHCGGEAPLLYTCWLSKDEQEPWGVGVVIDGQRGGKVRFEAYRIARGRGPNGEDPDYSTVSDGVGSCAHCRQAISGDEIKAQAQGRSEHGRWTDRLYCIAAVRFEPMLDADGRPQRYKSGERKGEIKTRKVRYFRPPNARDLDALATAGQRLADQWPQWEVSGLMPTEEIPLASNYNRGHRLYGITRWCDMFTPRQLLGHVTLIEELRRLTPEIISELGPERGRAVITYLQFVIDKAVDYNSKQTRWIPQRGSVSGTFSRHNFSLYWTFGEMIFSGPNSGAAWALNQVIDAYAGVAKLVEPVHRRVLAGASLPVKILHGTAAHLAAVRDGMADLVCIDPPYYNNVQYGELSDFYYVWQRRTLRELYPEVYTRRLVNKRDEAVANPARDGSAGAADAAYERMLREIFTECRRVLKPDGMMTVMFTHVSPRAWQVLTQSLIESGWTITSTMPVESEFLASTHQMDQAAAASAIFISCRRRDEAAVVAAAWTGVGGSGVQQRVRRAVENGLHDFAALRLNPIDEMVACYGRALQVLSEHWPVIDGDESVSPLRAMNEASSVVAASQISRITKGRMSVQELDGETRMALTAFGIFGLGDFAFDEALNLSKALGIGLHAAAGGYEVASDGIGFNTDVEGRTRRARDAEADAQGYAAPLARRGSKLRVVPPEERDPRRLAAPQTDWDRLHGLISEFRRGDAPVARAYLDRHGANREERILDLLDVWAAEVADPELKREAALIRFGLRPAAA
jgi:adenine-specific DNA methylase